MLSGFQSENQIDTSRLQFNVKVDQKVEKCASSGGFMSSSGFNSDPACNSSDYGVKAASQSGHVYQIGFQTMPLQFGGDDNTQAVKEKKSNLTTTSDMNCQGRPYRSNDCIALEMPKYNASVTSIYSTQACRGHDLDEKHDLPTSMSDSTCHDNEVNLGKINGNHAA